MLRWTPDRSAILSLLLDEVTGNSEAIDIRQDFCKMSDSFASTENVSNTYYTGSRAEGLDLPGSDNDYMYDINNMFCIRVTQLSSESLDSSVNNTLLLCAENVNPGFVLLRLINQPAQIGHLILNPLLHIINGSQYLSSDMVADRILAKSNSVFVKVKTTRQGPSVEQWAEWQDRNESGTDLVPSIHCGFWPNVASEWLRRSRHFG